MPKTLSVIMESKEPSVADSLNKPMAVKSKMNIEQESDIPNSTEKDKESYRLEQIAEE